MQMTWRDPRTGLTWTVTVAPVGCGTPAESLGLRSVAFHQRGSPPAWTRERVTKDLARFTDQELMDLLDRARSEHAAPRLRRGETPTPVPDSLAS